MARNGSNNTGLKDKLVLQLNAVGTANIIVEKSGPWKRFESRINDVNKILQESVSRADPELSLALEQKCVEFEREFFGHSGKDRERYDKYLSEIALAKKSLELTQDTEAYRQHVKDTYGPHREIKFPPTGEGYRLIADKHIKQLGRDKNGITAPKTKEFYDLRQANLRAGLNAYIDLQCKTLGISSPKKSQERGIKKDQDLSR